MALSTKKDDGRRKVSAAVRVKAVAITLPPECKRLYGSLWKFQVVTDVVQRVVKSPSGSDKQVSIVAKWWIGDRIKIKEVKLINVTLASTSSNTASASQNTNLPPESTQTESSAAGASETFSGSLRTAEVERTLGNRDAVTTRAVFLTSHGVHWQAKGIRLPLNGSVPRRHWSVSHVAGQKIAENQGLSFLSPFDYF